MRSGRWCPTALSGGGSCRCVCTACCCASTHTRATIPSSLSSPRSPHLPRTPAHTPPSCARTAHVGRSRRCYSDAAGSSRRERCSPARAFRSRCGRTRDRLTRLSCCYDNAKRERHFRCLRSRIRGTDYAWASGSVSAKSWGLGR